MPQLEQLKKIYRLHEKTMARIPMACAKGCADCCTCNVVVTSLETSFIVQSLDSKALADVHQRLTEKFPLQRYIPKMTLNQFAMACMSGRETPDEENKPDWGRCPFVEADICTIYRVRPFGCRSMISQIHCRDTGYAQVPPLALTINHIFLQYIEHLDLEGFSGNLSDMLSLFLANSFQQMTLPKGLDTVHGNPFFVGGEPLSPQGFIQNSKIHGLMVPPEHRDAVAPLLKQIAALTKTP